MEFAAGVIRSTVPVSSTIPVNMIAKVAGWRLVDARIIVNAAGMLHELIGLHELHREGAGARAQDDDSNSDELPPLGSGRSDDPRGQQQVRPQPAPFDVA